MAAECGDGNRPEVAAGWDGLMGILSQYPSRGGCGETYAEHCPELALDSEVAQEQGVLYRVLMGCGICGIC